MTDNIPSPSSSEDKIDLKDLVIPMWNARRLILSIALLGAVLGWVYGFLTPETYTSKSIFLPQTSQSGSAFGSLGGLASLAGINLNSGAGADGEISPTLFATIITSSPFQKQILDSKLFLSEDSISYREYLKNRPVSGRSIIQKYTIGLPVTILSFFTELKPKETSVLNSSGLVALDAEEFGLRNSLGGKISVILDKKEGFVNLIVVEDDPLVAAQVAQITESTLQNWIIEHKIKNVKAQYDFIERQLKVKEKEFFSIQEELANYTDRNQNVLSASYLTRLGRLQAEFDLANTVYSELAKQKVQIEIQLNKNTPTFSVIHPVAVPLGKNGPRMSIYYLGGFFLGFVFTATWALSKNFILSFIKDLKNPDTKL
jgi:hypothetical protein